MVQEKLTDVQEDFLKEMTRLISIVELRLKQTDVVNAQIRPFKETMARIEEKLDMINAYLLKKQQEEIKRLEDQI